MKSKLINQFVSEIKLLKDEVCWDIVFSDRAGSIIVLRFGEKNPVKKKIHAKDKLNGEIITVGEEIGFESDKSLFIECKWELWLNNNLLCNFESSNENNGPMQLGLIQLKNKKVIKIEVNSFKLNLAFDGNLNLKVFPTDRESDNYSFTSSKVTFIIDSKLNIRCENE